MTGAGRYAELAAAVRSFKAELIQPNQVERIIESGSLPEIISSLTHGRLAYSEGSDLSTVETYFVQRVVELAQRLAAYAPHDSRALIGLFSTSYELNCVKEILRSIADQVDPEDALRHLVPAGKFTLERCKELIEAHNPSRVLDLIDDDSLKRDLAPRVSGERSAMGATSAIDQYYYRKLWTAANLPDPLDAQSARGLIGELIDHLNIVLAFRARMIGMDARAASGLMIPVNYALGNALSDISESSNMQNLLRALDKTPYGKVFEGPGVADGNVASVERTLQRSHAASCMNAFAGSPFNVGLALALLFLKQYELHDIFSIINGKANKMTTDNILGSLVLRGS
jgi:vacuolar-type H+-ATPase subunit C/Vma6